MEVATPERAPGRGLAALPEPVLHAILARMPGNDAARAMGACRALAAAVRSMPEIGVELDLYMSSGLAPCEYMSGGLCHHAQARPSGAAGGPRSPPQAPAFWGLHQVRECRLLLRSRWLAFACAASVALRTCHTQSWLVRQHAAASKRTRRVLYAAHPSGPPACLVKLCGSACERRSEEAFSFWAGAFRPDGRLASLSAFLRRPGGLKLTALHLRMGKYLPPPGMPSPVPKMLREGESAAVPRFAAALHGNRCPGLVRGDTPEQVPLTSLLRPG